MTGLVLGVPGCSFFASLFLQCAGVLHFALALSAGPVACAVPFRGFFRYVLPLLSPVCAPDLGPVRPVDAGVWPSRGLLRVWLVICLWGASCGLAG